MSIRLKIGKLAQKIYRRCMELDECDLHEESLNALTPTLLTDEEFKLYAAEFFFVFSNPKIRNVALMGSYGAGKSSVIETWDEKQKQNGKKHTSTFISLAHFHGSNGDTNAIEGEILNQLIHKTDPRHIPKSRFKHTKDNSGILDLIKTIWCVAFGF